ncbi:MAG TPA: glutamate--tRNA ligase [Phycisphaerales bacterium]|nr:glutamate--tRNA ligase [Phycisphaerales bacterium]
MNPPITRFAPSPTGHLHIGGARTALFCAAYARGRNGRFVLRIEDTDQKRSSDAAAAGILDDLAWLGICWDDGPEALGCGGDPRGVGPFYQSQRRALYDDCFQTLLEAELAYPAFDSPEQLLARRKEAEKRKQTFIYRQSENYDHAEALERARSEPHVLRFKMPSEPITVHDEILGEVTFAYEELDDLVIRKRDGFPTYHFAVVVDDEAMGVTHVVRGQEHLNNTPRHVALMQALGYRVPRFAHLPLIFNPDGSKMSKRDKDKAVRVAVRAAGNITGADAGVDEEVFARWMKDKTVQLPQENLLVLSKKLGVDLPEIDVEDFRRAGYLPEAVVNTIALLGWNPGEKDEQGRDIERFDRAYLDRHFSFDRVGKSASKFDRDKLRAFNFDRIKAMPAAEFVSRWRQWCSRYDSDLLTKLDEQAMLMLAPAIQQRAATLAEAKGPVSFLFMDTGSIEYDEKAVRKHVLKGDPTGLELLREFADVLHRVDPFEPGTIESALASFCEAREIKMGRLAQPIRVALTGGAVSPPLGITCASLGRELVLSRVERCLAELSKH